MAGLDLSKQVGPLPLGAWMAVVAGGVGIAWYTRRQSANNAGTGEPDTSGGAVDGVGTGAVGGWSTTGPPTSGDTSNPVVETNEAWAVRAINWLIAQGYDATTADSAIRKYITATSNKSTREWAMINLALVHFGSPPNPLPPTDDSPPVITQPGSNDQPVTHNDPPPKSIPGPVTQAPPPPVTQASPQPAPVRWYVVKKGDNLWNIAKAYYGNGAQYVTIFNANRSGVRRPDGTTGMISNPNLIQPNWKLYIP